MIAIEDLTVRFGAVTALDRVSLRFEALTCALVGPAGAGKTTLLDALTGAVRPTAGRVSVDGREVGPRSGVRRTFQRERVVDELTVAENLGLRLGWGRLRDHGTPAREALAYVGLAVGLATPAWALDAHQRRLLELAGTVVGAPRLVLLDEPDPDLADVIRAIPERFGAQVVVAARDLGLAVECGATTVALDRGRVGIAVDS